MIEKLDLRENVEIIPIKGSCHDYCLAKSSVLIKINELVDVVNELQKDYDNVCVWVGEQKLNYNPDTTKGLSTLVEEPEPVDPYAEQRKWVGYLCRFRPGLGVTPTYGILGEILPDSDFPYYKKDTDTYWKYCEPVSLDDDIIYKGGDNE